MTQLDWYVLFGYFALMAGIGFWSMLKIKKQEDFFLGGRAFGKLLQTFAAFGAGTGSNDPVMLGRTTYTSGLSGIWSVLLWLFVTPFYWIFAVWYRRMRHLTLGDWFVERFQSPALGAAYTIFAIYFYMKYLSVAFVAIGKVFVPLVGTESVVLRGVGDVDIFYILVPTVAAVVLIYGALGGLRAAYYTDLIQGLMIILLSLILIPAGLNLLVHEFGDPATMGVADGFTVMHQEVPADYFRIIESPRGGEFPLYYIVAITLINLLGIVVQPHFIATGGGSAKSENSARVGLVFGNFLKRFCTVGWALTGLIALALFAADPQIAADPDWTWGIASRKILGPLGFGLVGLMLACLLAALMSSADCYMLVTSALVVRNLYAPFVNDKASEKTYIMLGRVVSIVIIGGAAVLALRFRDVFGNMKETWEITAIFFAVFWAGMFWRRATRAAAWITVGVASLMFFFLPITLPYVPGLATNPSFGDTNRHVTVRVQREATAADVRKQEASIAWWDQRQSAYVGQNLFSGDGSGDSNAVLQQFEQQNGARPKPIRPGDEFVDTYASGGKAVYWSSVKPAPGTSKRQVLEVQVQSDRVTVARPDGDNLVRETYPGRSKQQLAEAGPLVRDLVDRIPHGAKGSIVLEEWDGQVIGSGDFNPDFVIYEMLGIDLHNVSDAMLETLRLPTRIVLPFLVMFLASLVTRRNDSAALDRYYVKMKTPVEPDPAADEAELEASYKEPRRYDRKKLFGANSNFEFQRPTLVDVVGFIVSLLACFAIIGVAVWMASIGAS